MIQQNPLRGFLASVGILPEILVVFQYNPTQLTDKRTLNYATVAAPGLVMPSKHYTQGGDRTISFTVRIDGVFRGPADDGIPLLLGPEGSIQPELNKYRAFLYPKSERWLEANIRPDEFAALFDDDRRFASPPTCLFGWGQRVIECVVTELAITEQLFNRSLAPVRAEVSVTLAQLPSRAASLLGSLFGA